jgi:crotonobetainyl-CoA:carnitine CoA-transferase CaiB-like acyl-CoA transferase
MSTEPLRDPPDPAPPGPLAGIRVLDLSHMLNGPFCTMLLGHMGAEVLKLEHGAGDGFRYVWMAMDADHDGYEFLAVNANKKGITLNLKAERGRELFLDLVDRSDVLVENFSLGVMDRLGFSFEALRERNPRLVYATSKGYGESGPNAHVRAYAPTIMARSGWLESAWRTSGVRGTKVLGIGDEAAGVSLALGIVAALYSREHTGFGQKIEVSMQEALMGFMVQSFHTHFEGVEVGGRYYECADGYIAFYLPNLTDVLWEAFTTAIGHQEAREDPRFATPRERRTNFEVLEQTVGEWFRERSRAELWEIFKATGVASTPALTVEELIEDEHLRERGAFVQVTHPEAGNLTMLRPWIRFSDASTTIERAAPMVGEHNVEIYGELLGLDREEIQMLADEGVL